MIVSHAHEVAEAVPINRGVYVCMRCGLRGDLDAMFRSAETRCKPHIEADGSGWLDESATFFLGPSGRK